jgi:hypothetical protein
LVEDGFDLMAADAMGRTAARLIRYRLTAWHNWKGGIEHDKTYAHRSGPGASLSGSNGQQASNGQCGHKAH